MVSLQDKSLIELLLSRLERISADAYWAHRASGLRGSLLRSLEQVDFEKDTEEAGVKRTIAMGFHILEEAAKDKIRS